MRSSARNPHVSLDHIIGVADRSLTEKELPPHPMELLSICQVSGVKRSSG
jgi:hypothetical protein